MKHAIILRIILLTILSSAFSMQGCTDHEFIPEPVQFRSEDLALQLVTPFAVTKGAKDYLWFTEVGTGKNDGRVSVITPDGKIYPVIVNFTSDISEEEGLPDGLTHLTYKDGYLYIIQGIGGLLYKVDVSNYKPGDAVIQANTLSTEDIGQFVLDHDFIIDTGESHLYNLTWGPDGDLFFADAAANAIIRRKSSNGALTIFTEFSQLKNLAPVGPPMVDFVPTGITYDGTKFLVSSLSGFPFGEGNAAIYQLDMDGKPTLYKGGFTALTDLVLTPSNKPLAIQFAKFVLPDGFLPNTGKVVNEDGTTIMDAVMMPTDIERTGDKTYIIVSMAQNRIIKLSY